MFALIALFLTAASQSAPTAPAAAPPDPGTSFQTAKDIPQLESCLTARFAKYGEVTAVPIEGTKSLMFRITDEAPMVIDLSPPKVTITTKYPGWAKAIVQSCV